MTGGIFVTGTGTDVGKTYVSALLVRALRQNHVNAGYFKPALSGAVRQGDRLIPGDAAYVCRTAALPDPPETYVVYVYEPAVSPHLAARLTGKPPELPHMLARLDVLRARFAYVVAEGCGGLFCPLHEGEPPLFLTDVIAATGYPLALVTPSGLGALHAAMTTLAYAKQHGLRTRVLYMNRFVAGDPVHEDNRVQLARMTGLPVIPVAANAQTIDFSPLL